LSSHRKIKKNNPDPRNHNPYSIEGVVVDMKRKIGCFIRLKDKFALLVTLHDVGYVTTWQTSFLGHVNVEHYHPLNNINTLG